MGNYYDEYKKVKEIADLMERAWDIFSALPDEVRIAIQEYHGEHSAVGHCVCARWGTHGHPASHAFCAWREGAQNAKEITDDWHTVVSALKRAIE